MTTEQLVENQEGRTDEMIQQMIAEVDAGDIGDPAPPPGPGDEGPVLNREIDQGGESLEMPMVTASHSHAGYVYVYHIPTGERRAINKNMLPTQLKKLLEDGTPAFSLRPIQNPAIRPVQRLKCMLHPTDPNRAYYDTLGFPVCMKANLTSPYQVLRHMTHRHKDESANIEEERRARERREDREIQQRLYGAVSRANQTNGAAAPKPRRKTNHRVKKATQE